MIKRSYKSRLLVGVDDDLNALLLVAEGQLRMQCDKPASVRGGERRQQVLTSDVLGVKHDEVPQTESVVLALGAHVLQRRQNLLANRAGRENAVAGVGVAPITALLAERTRTTHAQLAVRISNDSGDRHARFFALGAQAPPPGLFPVEPKYYNMITDIRKTPTRQYFVGVTILTIF